MWSMCSIDTGHASTHAPQVTQSQIISSGTPFPTIGSPLSAKRILAVNNDPEAPILAVADYAVIGDLHEVVPAISAELRKVRG